MIKVFDKYIGKKYNKLTAIAFDRINYNSKRQNYETFYIFKCDCGNVKSIRISSVLSENTKACGCLYAIRKGLSTTPMHAVWSAMLKRCFNKLDPAYKNYGGRGIIVSDSWKNSFETFVLDMGPKPTPAHTVERIDNNKGYCKENCRWATRLEQGANRRNTRLATAFGETKTINAWSNELGLSWSSLHKKLKTISLELIINSLNNGKQRI